MNFDFYEFFHFLNAHHMNEIQSPKNVKKGSFRNFAFS